MKLTIIIKLAIILISSNWVKVYPHRDGDIKPFLYIRYYPIKTEDGCGYFSDNKDSLNQKKYVLITTINQITHKHIAYIQTGKHTFVFFNRTKRVKTASGYHDFYKSKNASFELDINNIVNNGNDLVAKNGHIWLTINNVKSNFNIYGLDKEADEYNDPFFKK